MWQRLKFAFTLIELLVVISILTILMAILLPSMGKSREAARRAVCMSNLRSTGQALHTYSNSNEGRLVPGDGQLPWEVWSRSHQVNLGYLLVPNKELPIPTSDDHVFFCPSMRTEEGDRGYKRFAHWWDSNGYTPIGYIYNNALDGFSDYVENAENCVLAHRDRANFLLGDGSVNFINFKPMMFDPNFAPETITEVCARYNATFPTIMLFNWFEHEDVNLIEARSFLSNPALWARENATANDANNAKPVLLASVAKKSLAADVVGGWGGGYLNRPGGPG